MRRLLALALVLTGCVPPLLGVRGDLHPADEPSSNGSAALPPGLYVATRVQRGSRLPDGVRPSTAAYVDGYRIQAQGVVLWPDGLFASTLSFPSDSFHVERPVPGSPVWDRDALAAAQALVAFYTTGRGRAPGTPSVRWGTWQIRADTLELRQLSLSGEAWPYTGGVSTSRIAVADSGFTRSWIAPGWTGELEPVEASYRWWSPPLPIDRTGNPAAAWRPR
ncbi:hypothetical protein [Rubrivirga sp. IMCC45206]|uniref:hypothetical protein n=1 Tax=Rubrivirga sp. IMCC45206 TaxID=3391614 RepID=UPI00398FC008